jgi:mxaJ protein
MVAAAENHQRLHHYYQRPELIARRAWRASALLCLLASGNSLAAPAASNPLTVCADPNNLPFSNQAREGFENKIMDLVAKDLHRPLTYLWWAQRRGYVRNTLNEDKCDIWPGVASGLERLATTRAYYRSTYVFVTRLKSHLDDLTLDDPRLRTASIGVQLVGNDGNNTPPAHVIASRGIVSNVHGYMLYGNYSDASPAAAIVRAVAKGDVDIAMAWGPLAGYFAKQSKVPLTVRPITSAAPTPWPMQFDVSMGVRNNDVALLAQLNQILGQEQHAIDRILRQFGVPRTDIG